jgi:hypothetical protein
MESVHDQTSNFAARYQAIEEGPFLVVPLQGNALQNEKLIELLLLVALGKMKNHCRYRRLT